MEVASMKDYWERQAAIAQALMNEAFADSDARGLMEAKRAFDEAEDHLKAYKPKEAENHA